VLGAMRPMAILVPQRAVQQGAKGHFVWVVSKENKAEQRPVVVGDWQGNNWFITEGLQGGEVVVVDGGLALQAGAPVKIKTEASAAEPAAAAAPPKAAAEKKEPALGDK
jgi:membrane fusion protein (multidrug efflux system)